MKGERVGGREGERGREQNIIHTPVSADFTINQSSMASSSDANWVGVTFLCPAPLEGIEVKKVLWGGAYPPFISKNKFILEAQSKTFDTGYYRPLFI